jgi:hypothetical protein
MADRQQGGGQMSKAYVIKIIQGVIYLFSSFLLFFDFFKIENIIIRVTIIGAGIVLYLLFCIADIRREKQKEKEQNDTVTLNENSNEFFDYFNKWYTEPGKLSIFCTDLDWMRHETHDLVSTICRKGKNCTVYLRKNITLPDRQMLEKAGVKIIIFDSRIRTAQRFSLREDEGFISLIVRNKNMTSRSIEFKEEDSTRSPYLINLSKDLLELLDKQNG